MALDVKPENLLQEIQAAEQLRDRMVERAEDIINSMAGYDFVAGHVEGKSTPDNYIFEYVALMLGRLVSDNPAAACSVPFQQYQPIADAIQEAVDKWFKSIDHQSTEFKDQLMDIVTDQLVLWGSSLITYEEDKEAELSPLGTKPMRPVSTHIPYWRFFKDHKCAPGIKCRFKGHRAVRDKDDLLNDPHYDKDKVEKLVSAIGGIGGDGGGEDKATRADGPTRNEVAVYEIWVPDADPTEYLALQAKKMESDEDKAAFLKSMKNKVHGVIFTLATCNVQGSSKEKPNAGYLRDPQAYMGPAWGPYVEWGGFPVPGSPYTLSSLQATKEQGDETNAQQLAIVQSALERKTVILTNASNAELKNRLKNAQNGHVYGVKGYQKGAFDQVEIGGPTSQMIEYANISTERRDRVLGMSEAMRGTPDSGTTATADNISAQANNVRIEVMVQFVKRAVAQTIRTVAWYMFNSEFFVQHLSEEFGKKYGMKNPVLAGGDQQESEDGQPNPMSGLRFDDLALDIQPYSMERVDPVLMQGRVQQVLGFVLQTLPMRVQFPFANWKLIDEQMARAHNFKWLDDIVDENAMQQYRQQMAQSAGQQRPPSLSINYKDLPEDDRRAAEQMAGLPPSQQPMTAPDHVQNQMQIVQQRQDQQQQAAGPSLRERMMGKAGKKGRAA